MGHVDLSSAAKLSSAPDIALESMQPRSIPTGVRG